MTEAEQSSSGEAEILDITGEQMAPLSAGLPAVGKAKPLDVHRYKLTKLLVWITASLAVGLLLSALLARTEAWDRVSTVSTLVFAPFPTLLGTALGWYFSGKQGGD